MPSRNLYVTRAVRVHFLDARLPREASSCGADRDRTGDLRLAKPALSQLSYSPLKAVGQGRVELPTSRLSGVRSNHLSYWPSPVGRQWPWVASRRASVDRRRDRLPARVTWTGERLLSPRSLETESYVR
jgi:hypothetical protein